MTCHRALTRWHGKRYFVLRHGSINTFDTVIRSDHGCGFDHTARATTPSSDSMSFNTFGHLFPGHDLRRKPRAGDRLRGRRLSAAHSADRSRYPALSRQAPARPIALHHPAAGAGHGQNPLRRVRRRSDRPAGDDRHADRAADRQCRSALEGLFRHQGQVPAGPRRLHLRRQIRLARLSRRRPRLGARDRDAGRGRRHRAQDRARAQRARRADPDGPHTIDRARWDWDEVERNPFFCPDAKAGRVLRRLSRRRAQDAAPRSAR